MLLSGSRLGRWPILAWAPDEDGPNLRRTTPKSPVRVAGGRTRLLPADGPLGVISAPRNSRGLPESRSRKFSSYDPKAAEPHRRNGGWRHPPPSGSPSGPVSPSGRNSNPDFPVQPRRPLGAKRNLEGGRGRVKAMFPLATRVCPAHDGRNYFDGISGDEPSLGPSTPGCPPVDRHRHRSHGTPVRGPVSVRHSKQPAAHARKVLLNRHGPAARTPQRR
jgi:hypothetical protein